MLRLTPIVVGAALASSAAFAQYPPPGTPADARCREVAQARIFSEPNPEGLRLEDLGYRIWKKCLDEERGAAKGTRAKATPAAATPPATPAAAPTTAPTAVPTSTATALSTTGFRDAAIQLSAFEIESSRVALARSRDGAVRAFARRMIADHAMMSQALNGGAAVSGAASAGAAASGAPAPANGVALEARHAAVVAELAAMPVGPRFDAAYGALQLKAHEEAVAIFTAYAQGGFSPPLRAFAEQALPYLQQHLAMARRLPGARVVRR
jgi:putative membrane protein